MATRVLQVGDTRAGVGAPVDVPAAAVGDAAAGDVTHGPAVADDRFDEQCAPVNGGPCA